MNTLFFQVPTLEFGHGAGARVQSLDLVLGHKSGHRVPMHTIFVGSGQSKALFALLSSCFKMASDSANWSNYVHSHISGTQSVNTTPFRLTKYLSPEANWLWWIPSFNYYESPER